METAIETTSRYRGFMVLSPVGTGLYAEGLCIFSDLCLFLNALCMANIQQKEPEEGNDPLSERGRLAIYGFSYNSFL